MGIKESNDPVIARRHHPGLYNVMYSYLHVATHNIHTKLVCTQCKLCTCIMVNGCVIPRATCIRYCSTNLGMHLPLPLQFCRLHWHILSVKFFAIGPTYSVTYYRKIFVCLARLLYILKLQALTLMNVSFVSSDLLPHMTTPSAPMS